jgi:hypothetical protein
MLLYCSLALLPAAHAHNVRNIALTAIDMLCWCTESAFAMPGENTPLQCLAGLWQHY